MFGLVRCLRDSVTACVSRAYNDAMMRAISRMVENRNDDPSQLKPVIGEAMIGNNIPKWKPHAGMLGFGAWNDAVRDAALL